MDELTKQTIKDDLPNYLQGLGINVNKPFICLNPDHSDRDPSMRYDKRRNKAHCFSCEADYDTFDLIGIDYNLTAQADIFNKAGELYGVVKTGTPVASAPPKGLLQRQAPPPIPSKEYDFTDIIERAHQDERGRAYYKSRGLTDEIINRYKLGYTDSYNALLQGYPELQSKGRKQGLYNYVLPYLDNGGKCRYLLAEISDRSAIDEYNGKYRKMQSWLTIDGVEYEHPAHIFNERYIREAAPTCVFVCEGIYDALSYESVGAQALAFIGTADRRFLNLCREHKPATHFIITLDNDGAGQTATERVTKGLTELGIPFTIANPAGKYKDANEALQADKEGFRMAVLAAVQNTQQTEEEKAKAAYLKTSAAGFLRSFTQGIKESVNTPYIPTGFNALDDIFDGGLFEGFYCVGGISSLGKTTVVMQIADQIAQKGQDVIVFSLEMARNELIAKSVSRLTFELCTTPQHAKTTRGITTYSRYDNYSQTEKDLIGKSLQAYGEYATRLFIHEGIGDLGVKQVREAVKNHIAFTGKAPVVVIDYLQILAPYEIKATDKQNTDKAVLELKRMSRDFKTPVIAISSFNRASYKEAVSMADFKESGAIEYSADVLIGLQLKGAGTNGFNVDEAKKKDPREIELRILKNRNGRTGETIAFKYYPMFNYFEQI